MAQRGIGRNEEGTTLVMIALLLALFCGLLAMTFDVGRIAVTQSEMQSYADNVALAAAAELDGRPDAITRATNAAAAMISDTRTYGDAAAGSAHTFTTGDYTLTFYSALPGDDTTAPTATTTDPKRARYARVQVTEIGAGFVFARAFALMSGQAQLDDDVSAEAIAGMTQYACDITPLMFCVPPPSGSEGIWQANNHVGSQILLRAGGNSAAWGPGDFGFLDPDDVLVDPKGPCAGLKGGQKIRCVIGAVGNVSQCFAQNGVDTEPGQKVGIEDGAFNVRFDIWTGNMKSRSNNADFAPAPNVVKGIKPKGGGTCINNNSEATTDTLRLPNDSCFAAGTCTRYGDGTWSDTAYLSTNHNGVDPRNDVDFTIASEFTGTRWEMYLAEIALANKQAAALAANPAAPPTGSPLIDRLLSEKVGPSCAPAPTSNAARRVIYVAAINCDPDNGGTAINGREEGVPVQEFVKMFLTEPVSSNASSPPTLSIRAEVLGSAGGAGGGAGSPGGVFRDVVQLYR